MYIHTYMCKGIKAYYVSKICECNWTRHTYIINVLQKTQAPEGTSKIVVVITVLLYLILETATHIYIYVHRSSTCCVAVSKKQVLYQSLGWWWRMTGLASSSFLGFGGCMLMEMALSLHGKPVVFLYSLWSWYHSLRKIMWCTTAIPFFPVKTTVNHWNVQPPLHLQCPMTHEELWCDLLAAREHSFQRTQAIDFWATKLVP